MTAGRAIIGVLALWLTFSGVAAADQLYVNRAAGGAMAAFNAGGTPITCGGGCCGCGGCDCYVETAVVTRT